MIAWGGRLLIAAVACVRVACVCVRVVVVVVVVVVGCAGDGTARVSVRRQMCRVGVRAMCRVGARFDCVRPG